MDNKLKGKRYRLADKARRNKKIINYKEQHPGATTRSIAAIFKLSHVRVAAILRKNGSK